MNPIQPTRRALTLLEIVVATMVTGVMLVAALDSVGAVFNTHKLNAERLAGPSIGHELMAEILAMPYKDPTSSTVIGPEGGESTTNRNAFDDVDDYDNLNTLGLRTKSGVVRAGFTGLRTQVDVQWAGVLTGLDWIWDTGLKRITVTVTSPSGEVTVLKAYRFDNGMLEQAPAVDTSAVTWIGAELQLGTTSKPARMGTNLTNHTPDAN
ncbi:MAG: hypothetical protein SH868_17020 [Bythopirellula sp.]|nr:hypothetical protein [Bythopirellula sp.]